MKHRHVNGYDMAYLEVGAGPALVCVHGSLCDFRIWSPVLGPLSQNHRVIAVSLRHCFPEHWDGSGDGFTTAQHIADVIAFIEALGDGPVHLMGHSRGGHVSFRVAQRRPDLIRRLVLAEPGGELDASLAVADMPPSPLQAPLANAVEKIAAGDVDAGLPLFIDAIDGDGAWRRLPPATKQELRDNARTLIAQVRDKRPPFSKTDTAQIVSPTLLVGGADTRGLLPLVLQILSQQIAGAQVVMIPHAGHSMFVQQPVPFCDAVLDFLAR